MSSSQQVDLHKFAYIYVFINIVWIFMQTTVLQIP